jgi:dihydropyrimidinase
MSGLTAPPEVVSRAALFGGTTTMIDFARWMHGNTVQGTIEARDKDWIGRCFTDFAYHLMVEGLFPVGLTDQVAEAIQEGYATVKIFTTDITPSRKGRMVGYGDIWEMFKVLSKNGGLGVIHAEDNDIVMHMYEKLFREGRTGFENMAEVHNTLSEDLSFRRVIRLAEEMNTAIYMMHVSAGTGVQAIREARSRGKPVYGETLHQYILHTAEDYKLPNGQMFHTYPSLKGKEDTDALWKGVSEDVIHSIATDELCCSLAVKTQGKRIDDTTGGNTGVEPRVSLMYTEMVEKRGYSLTQFVDLISSNAARILGMYPRKGAIAAGSDADLVILDPGLARTIQNKDLHESDYTPWEGHQVGVWPCLTMLRGKIMVEDDQFFGKLSDGQYLKRKIAPEILAGTKL